MAEFLSTTGISHQLEEIIRNAQERLWLFSPFLKVSPRIKQLLEDANRLKIDARVIYGKNELQPEESAWLESMTSIRTLFCKHLHAKCYLNENQALLTSMNLYEFSQVNNYEMGILVSREESQELYDNVYLESQRILRASDEIRVTISKVVSTEDSIESPGPTLALPGAGFCIRDQTKIDLDPTKPYCLPCYRKWNRYKNAEYKEQYCHICGDEHTTALKSPACRRCYRRYKDVLQFSAG